jgi:hypothetical protein
MILLAFWLPLLAQPGNGTELAHQKNPVYLDALRSGLQLDGATVKLPGPILKDGLNAEQQNAALLELCGSEWALADLVRDSVTAPFLLKTRDLKTKDGTVRIVDLWFVVRADLESLDPDELVHQANGKAVEVGNMRFENRILTEDELKPRGRSSRRGRELSCWFIHLNGRLLDRIAVELSDESVATRSEESLVIAGRTDHAFDSGETSSNRWQAIGADDKAGPWHRLDGGFSYAKITRLKRPIGALLIEMHAAFSEPEAWFQGAPILRSKFAPVAQDQIRRLRRKLLKHPKATTPAPANP